MHDRNRIQPRRQGISAIALAGLGALLIARPLFADEQTDNVCMAPNFKHEVLLQKDEATGLMSFEIRASDGDKPLFSRPTGGHGHFPAETELTDSKCLWSPDSRLVAIFGQSTKRTGETSIYSVSGEKVDEIAFPDLMPLIERHLTAEMRALWIRPEVWLPNHELILSVVGTQMDEEHGNFRFILTLKLLPEKAGKIAAKIVSLQLDRSIDFSIK